MDFLLRFGAGCGILCGLLLAVPGAVEAFTGETTATSVVLGLAPALGAPLLTAAYLGQHRAAGRFGRLAYAVNLVGLGLFGGAAFALNLVLFFLDEAAVTALLRGPTRLALLGGALVFVLGSVMFGAAMVRAKVYPRVPAWAYGIALTVFALAAPLPDSPLTSGLHVVVGIILVWLSVAVLRSESTAART
ncbi:MAG TPA: hypothetical protein VFR67_22860 [Pilimelia sp.]|nr:hypothetical protein [Pilimelia sp.]